MTLKRLFFTAGLLGIVLGLPRTSHAGAGDAATSTETADESSKKDTLPWAGTTLLFNQNMSTQTAGLDRSQQTYIGDYQWWLVFSPRYKLNDNFSVSGRIDYSKEFTNSSPTKYAREDQIGDTWLNAMYSERLKFISPETRGSVGIRLVLPTSKVSRARGDYLSIGPSVGLSHSFKLRAQDKPFSRLGLSWNAIYSHPFANSKTAYNRSFTRVRQDTNGQSVDDHTLSGVMMSNHNVMTAFRVDVQIIPKLTLSPMMAVMWAFKHSPPDATVNTLTGPVDVARSPDATTLVTRTWFLTDLTYDLFDELSLGIGYYNLQNTLAPDGKQRTPFGKYNYWWSPDARLSFDVTFNLDKIYERFRDLARPKNASASL